MNLLVINLSALILFYLSGFKPSKLASSGMRASVFSRIVVIAIDIAVLSIVLCRHLDDFPDAII